MEDRIEKYVKAVESNAYKGENLQRTEKDDGEFVCRDGLEGLDPREEKEESLYGPPCAVVPE